jgi:NADH-quinone oxidoreductase subunit N
MKVLNVPFVSLLSDWSPIVMIMAILSMAIGSIMALKQNNLKRLLAFSSISNVGFILVGVMLGTPVSVMSVLVYLTFYTLTTVGIFAMLMSLRHKDVYLEDLDDLAGFARQYPVPGLALLVLLFSLAGIPPLSGFFAKFYILAGAVQAGFTWLAVLSVIFAVIGAAYCLKILKVLFFDNPTLNRHVDIRRTGLSRYVGYAMAILALVFGILPNLITELATVAAQGLF